MQLKVVVTMPFNFIQEKGTKWQSLIHLGFLGFVPRKWMLDSKKMLMLFSLPKDSKEWFDIERMLEIWFIAKPGFVFQGI